MKQLLLILSLIQFTLFAGNEKTLKSTINGVTVYQQGAQINRKAYYNISASGVTKLIINGISPRIDPKSIQVNGTGSIIILDSKYNIEYPEPVKNENTTKNPKLEKELALLNDSLFDIQFDIMEINNKIDILNKQKAILQNNGTIKGVGKVNDSIPLLREALLFYSEKMNLLNHELLTENRKQQLVNKTKYRIEKRITEIKNYNSRTNQAFIPSPKQPKHQVIVTVSSKGAASGKINLSYLVNYAGWVPLYDIRSNTSKNTIDLTYKAHVYQNTGVDWKNTKLKLSTNNPYANKTKPELSPFYVNYYNNFRRELNGKKKVSLTPSRPNNAYYDMNKNREKYADDMEVEEELAEVDASYAYEHTQIIEQLIDVEYAIDLPYSIKSNNEKHMVLVHQESLGTSYQFYTVPKMDLSTFLVAEISNLGDLNLIPGNANIFHDGTYLGETFINAGIMDDTLSLSLGKENKVQVKHTLLKSDCKTKVIGDKTVKTYAYLIEVKNHKSSSINITVNDQIPVTQNSEIEIEVEELSKGRLNEVTGIIDWDIKLKPKATEKIKLVYTVSYSKTKQINLAQY